MAKAVVSIQSADAVDSALIEGDGWIEQGANLLLFGPPGVGKSHLVCAIGNGLIDPRLSRLFLAHKRSGAAATGGTERNAVAGGDRQARSPSVIE